MSFVVCCFWCSDKRGSGGQRIIAGSIHARLAAGPPPGYSKPGALLRLAYSYLITPYTLELHTSGVLACISRDERDDARGELVKRWLVEHGAGGQTLPEPLVGQVRAGGEGRPGQGGGEQFRGGTLSSVHQGSRRGISLRGVLRTLDWLVASGPLWQSIREGPCTMWPYSWA